MLQKSLDLKLSRILADSSCNDFIKMSQAEKVAWNLDRWRRILG
jgi:hypothetical protein